LVTKRELSSISTLFVHKYFAAIDCVRKFTLVGTECTVGTLFSVNVQFLATPQTMPSVHTANARKRCYQLLINRKWIINWLCIVSKLNAYWFEFPNTSINFSPKLKMHKFIKMMPASRIMGAYYFSQMKHCK